MSKNRFINIAAMIAVMLAICAAALAQSRKTAAAPGKSSTNAARITNKAGAKSAHRTYTPKVIGNSDSLIVEGVVSTVTSAAIIIKTPDGQRHSFDVDDQTTLYELQDFVSIATMAEITLSIDSLRVSDRVEIVAEREANRNLARIITRVERGQDRIARR